MRAEISNIVILTALLLTGLPLMAQNHFAIDA